MLPAMTKFSSYVQVGFEPINAFGKVFPAEADAKMLKISLVGFPEEEAPLFFPEGAGRNLQPFPLPATWEMQWGPPGAEAIGNGPGAGQKMHRVWQDYP